MVESQQGGYMFSGSSDATVTVREWAQPEMVVTVTGCVCAGVESGEHAAHFDAATARESSPLARSLARLRLHWLRRHGDQGQSLKDPSFPQPELTL